MATGVIVKGQLVSGSATRTHCCPASLSSRPWSGQRTKAAKQVLTTRRHGRRHSRGRDDG